MWIVIGIAMLLFIANRIWALHRLVKLSAAYRAHWIARNGAVLWDPATRQEPADLDLRSGGLA